MRLDELIGIKTPLSKITNKFQIETFMKKHGYPLLGEGFYSFVFQDKNPNYVIKIGQDSGYLKFINYCIKNPNEHFPKIDKMFNLPIWEGWNVFRMEKLTPLPKKYNFGSSFLSHIIKQQMPYEQAKLNLSNPKYSFYDRDIARNINIGTFAIMFKSFFEHYLTKDAYDVLITMEHSLGNSLYASAYINDLGSNNMMLRGNILVFIDPRG